MKITVVGRGNIGGGLAKLWRAAGHEVQEIGREGGNAADADLHLQLLGSIGPCSTGAPGRASCNAPSKRYRRDRGRGSAPVIAGQGPGERCRLHH
jgi:hypothetical protein